MSAALPTLDRAEDRRPATRPRRWRAGTCPRPSSLCDACSKPAWARRASASTSRCSVCWRPSGSKRSRVRSATRSGSAQSASMRVKHLVLCRIERRPPRLNLDVYPYLPRARVATTSAKCVHDACCRGSAHDRHTAGAARPPPQEAEAADVPEGVRQDRPAVSPRKASTTFAIFCVLPSSS